MEGIRCITKLSVVEFNDLRNSGLSVPKALERLPIPIEVLLARGERTSSEEAQLKPSWSVASLEQFEATLVRGDTYAVPVEASVLRMASGLSMPRVALLIDEVCGTYRVPRREAIEAYHEAYPRATVHYHPRGSDALTCDSAAFYGMVPLTSTRKIEEYVARHPGMPGAKRVREALPFCADGLRSYLEAMSYHLLFMPTRFGGLSLPKPQVNHRIDVPKRLRELAGKPYIIADDHWPEHAVALELLGFSDHGGDGITDTSVREKLYASLAIDCVTMTYREVTDPKLFMNAARHLARLLGHRLRVDIKDFKIRQQWLREELALRLHDERRGRMTYHELVAELEDRVPLEARRM